MANTRTGTALPTTKRLSSDFPTKALTQQKVIFVKALLETEGRISFELYKQLINQDGADGVKGKFFFRFISQCFDKNTIGEFFQFNISRHMASNVHKMAELHTDEELKLKFHFFLKG